MGAAASVASDLTTCSICREQFTNPKALPCMHTFCLTCLEGQFGNKLPGETAACSMCREEFQIPSDGVNGLKHHFMVQQLLELNSRMRHTQW